MVQHLLHINRPIGEWKKHRGVLFIITDDGAQNVVPGCRVHASDQFVQKWRAFRLMTRMSCTFSWVR